MTTKPLKEVIIGGIVKIGTTLAALSRVASWVAENPDDRKLNILLEYTPSTDSTEPPNPKWKADLWDGGKVNTFEGEGLDSVISQAFAFVMFGGKR